MNNIITKEICDGVNFTYIPSNKFKTTVISFSAFSNLNKEDISKNSIIPCLLTNSCKKYPSFLKISTKLEELYGSSVSKNSGKLGDVQVLTISAESLNNEFTQNSENNILETSKLLCEMIFNPNIIDGKFDEVSLNQEKRQLIENIQAELNDKRLYARKKCEEIMCKNEKYGINESVETVQNLKNEDIFEAWKNILKSSHIEIIVVGNCEYNLIFDEFKNNFSNIERSNIEKCEQEIVEEIEKITEATEKMDVTQCKLVMGFRTKIAKPSEDVDAVKVMNALLGGTPQSKLFLNVREKKSLCYYCSSRYNPNKGVLFIESGVEKENIDKAKEEILNQIQEIKLGNFSDKDLLEIKLFITQSIQKIDDDLGALGSWYVSRSFDENKQSPINAIEKINSVSREKVIEVAEKLSLDTVYTLSGKDGI